MLRRGTASAAALLMLSTGAALSAQEATSAGTVAEVRVHGNHTTPEADILAIVGNVVGQPATDALVADIAGRLEKSGRFDGIDVRKRYRSISGTSDILLMIVVDEVPGVSELDLTPGPWKRFTSSGMFMPIVRFDDGYGFTYGARLSFVDRLGPRSRVSVPLTWGGERQARLQLERTFTRGAIDRLVGDAGIGRRENPHYKIGDTRTGAHVRAETAIRRWLRAGAGAGIENVRFGALTDRIGRARADIALDTRVDPAFPRNAVHTTVGWERLSFDAGSARRVTTDIRGYVGIYGQTVLAVRGLLIAASDPLPIYEQSLLGGDAMLRGYDAGYKANDSVSTGTAELRIPVSSPLSMGRLGVKVFVDAGTAFASGARLKKQHYESSYGAGLYLHLTILSLSLDVARSEAGSTRAHFGMGVTFR